MKTLDYQQKRAQWILVAVLVCLGVLLRIGAQDYPNISPVAGLALFAGYVLRSRLLAIAVPLAVLTFSDLYFGGYTPMVMVSVYALLALPVLAGIPLKNLHRNKNSRSWTVLSLGFSSLLFSILFFLGTNLAVWASTTYYSRDIVGLVDCYNAALPFFRHTVIGDLLFVSVFFGGYALCHAWLASRLKQLASQ